MERKDQYLSEIQKLKTLIGHLLQKNTQDIYVYKQQLTNEYFDKQLIQIDSIENWDESDIAELQIQPSAILKEIVNYIHQRLETEPTKAKSLHQILKTLILYYDAKKQDFNITFEEKLKQYR